jgi:hypothetical protein
MRGGLEQPAALGRLIVATGRTVLTASTSDKPALEGYHGHGVFTYALLDGLSHADRDNDGMIRSRNSRAMSTGRCRRSRRRPSMCGSCRRLTSRARLRARQEDRRSRRSDGDSISPAQPAPTASADIPAKPNYVISELAKVFQGTVGEELKPYTAVV